MTTQVITASQDTLASEALFTLEQRNIKRLPVLEDGRLVGLIHRNELIRSLFLNKDDPPVGQLMVSDVVTVWPEATLEEATLLMVEHHIAGLPVVDGRPPGGVAAAGAAPLVGIITESDIFKAFVRVMGLLEGGQRVTIRIKDRPGMLIAALEPVRRHELNIISVTSCKVPGAPPGTREVTLRLQTEELSLLVNELLKNRVDVVDWR